MIKVFGFIGYVDQHGTAPDSSFVAFATDFLNEVLRKPLLSYEPRTLLLRLLIVRLELANLTDLRDAVLSFLQQNVGSATGYEPGDLCSIVQLMAPARVQRDPSEPLDPLLNLCPVDTLRTGIVQTAKKYLINLHDETKLNVFYAANKLQYLDADQIEQVI